MSTGTCRPVPLHVPPFSDQSLALRGQRDQLHHQPQGRYTKSRHVTYNVVGGCCKCKRQEAHYALSSYGSSLYFSDCVMALDQATRLGESKVTCLQNEIKSVSTFQWSGHHRDQLKDLEDHKDPVFVLQRPTSKRICRTGECNIEGR